MRPRGLGTNHARYALKLCARLRTLGMRMLGTQQGVRSTEYGAEARPYSHGAVYVSVHLKGANTQVFKKIHCKLATQYFIKLTIHPASIHPLIRRLILHGSILLVTMPPPAHPPGFVIFFFLGGLFPTTKLLIQPHIHFLLHLFYPYKSETTRFHNFCERFPEFTERRIRDAIM